MPEARAAGADDGLEEVPDEVFTQAWQRPGEDLSGFSRIRFQAGGMAYLDPNRARRRSSSVRRGSREYEPSAKDKRAFETLFAEEFSERFRSIRGYRIVADVDPDTLVVRTALVNIDLSAMGDPITNTESLELEAQGGATLIVELYDGADQTLLARWIDARGVQLAPLGGSVQPSRSNMVLAGWRRLAGRWAAQVTGRLEALAGVAAPAD